jgi:flagellar motor switch protein FliN
MPEPTDKTAVATAPAPAEPAVAPAAATAAPATTPAAPAATPASAAAPEIPPLPDFSGMLADAAANTIDLLKDVELNVKIELGRAEMTVEQVLALTSGAVVELDKLAGDPVDVLVNEQLVARGEVLVLNDNFCIRINEIIPGVTEKMMQK